MTLPNNFFVDVKVLDIKIKGKKGVWSSFLRNYWKIFKIKILVLKFLKRLYFNAFFKHSTHKNENLAKNLRVEYFYICI